MLKNYSESKKNLFYRIIFKLITVCIALVILNCSDNADIDSPSKGKLVVTSIPERAEIFINGNTTQKLTPDSIELDAGAYSIKLILPTYHEVSQTAIIELNKTTKIDATLQSGITIAINTVGTKIYFSYQINIPVNLESITVTRPTSNNSNYVIYSELLNNATINPNNTYRFPQLSINDFTQASGNFTFLFKGFADNKAFENEVVYHLN